MRRRARATSATAATRPPLGVPSTGSRRRELVLKRLEHRSQCVDIRRLDEVPVEAGLVGELAILAGPQPVSATSIVVPASGRARMRRASS